MAEDLPQDPRYKTAMQRLEDARRRSKSGSEYWFAREIREIFGYETWAFFIPVISRAELSFEKSGNNASHHIVPTQRMMVVGKGARREGDDFFLSRAACYLIAMNGDSSKPEIAASQAYFATQTREWEVAQKALQDEKRLEIREKVKTSFKAVSGAAKSAGVKNSSQAIFHDARNVGLYGMTVKEVKARKGIGAKENAFDRMGALELSAHDFQMNLAAETIEKENVRGEFNAIRKNREVAHKVRQTMLDSGSRPPEELPAAEPIKEVVKRVKTAAKKKIMLPSES